MTDQEQFDQDVNRVGKRILVIAGGVGIVAALVMSTVALQNAGGNHTTTMMMRGAAAAPSAPRMASVAIDHVTRGCHVLDVNGAGPGSPRATIRLAAGGTLRLQDNDVMPHQLVLRSGPAATIVGADMSHMGAKSTVNFATPGTYSFTTKAGEDYIKGVKTLGPDNTIRLKVVVV
jgi:plastocyanin